MSDLPMEFLLSKSSLTKVWTSAVGFVLKYHLSGLLESNRSQGNTTTANREQKKKELKKKLKEKVDKQQL